MIQTERKSIARALLAPRYSAVLVSFWPILYSLQTYDPTQGNITLRRRSITSSTGF